MKLQEEHQRFGVMVWDEDLEDICAVIPVFFPLPFPFPEGFEKTLPLSQIGVS